MKKLLLFILLLTNSVIRMEAQKVFLTAYASQADIKVFVVKYESQART